MSDHRVAWVVEGGNDKGNDDDKKYLEKRNCKSQNFTAHAEK